MAIGNGLPQIGGGMPLDQQTLLQLLAQLGHVGPQMQRGPALGGPMPNYATPAPTGVIPQLTGAQDPATQELLARAFAPPPPPPPPPSDPRAAAAFLRALPQQQQGLPVPQLMHTQGPMNAFDQSTAVARHPAPQAAFPQSYKDPAWNQYEANAEAHYNLPSGTLAGIRLRGERSNNDQVSSAGARTVYQIIPSTAAGIQKNYGFNPYSSPQNAAMGAAAMLAEGRKRTGSMAGAVQQYIGGVDPSQYGPQTANYMQRVLGGVSDAGGLQNPFDPSYGNAALAQLDKGEKAALTPFSASYDLPKAPDVPDPILTPHTDFSAVDAALQQLRPQEMTEKEASRIRRSNLFKGMGQALASLPDGAGLGRVLAVLGGGALMGKAAGSDELQARKDKFDDNMARYNVALFNNETRKADVLHQELAADTAALNTHATQQFNQAYDIWSKTNNASIQGDAFITSKHNPTTGKVTVTRTPIAAAVASTFAMNKANVLMSMMGAQNQGNAMVAQGNNALIMGASAQQAMIDMQNPQGKEADPQAALVMGVAPAATAVVENGLEKDLIGDAFDEFNADVDARTRAMGLMPDTKEYADARQQVAATQIAAKMLVDPKFREQAMNIGAPGMMMTASRNAEKRKTQTQVTPRGVRTTTTDVGP